MCVLGRRRWMGATGNPIVDIGKQVQEQVILLFDRERQNGLIDLLTNPRARERTRQLRGRELTRLAAGWAARGHDLHHPAAIEARRFRRAR